jgi:hypothetical protein
LLVSSILFLGIAIGIVWFFKDKIIHLFVEEANKHIIAKINVEKIDIDFIETFPQFSIRFSNIEAMETIANSNITLLKAEKIFFSFSACDILERKYKLKNIYLKNAKLNLKIFADGSTNFEIFKRESNPSNQKISLSLKNISIENTDISYQNLRSKQETNFAVVKLNSNFRLENEAWKISLIGNFRTNKIKLNESEFFKNKTVLIVADFIFNPQSNFYETKNTNIQINKAIFDLKGKMKMGLGQPFIDASFSATKTDIQSLISLLPNTLSKPIQNYQSKGNLYFNGKIYGQISKFSYPNISISFGCNNASFYHPDFQNSIKEVSFEGKFLHSKTDTFYLKNINALLDEKPLKGNFELTNFKHPLLAFNLETNMDAAFASKLIQNKSLTTVSGEINANLSFQGNLEELKAKNYENVLTNGEISFRNLNFDWNKKKFKDVNGNLIFNKHEISAQDFSLHFGNSDLYWHGIVGNIFQFLFYKNKPLFIEGSLKSNHLDLDELLSENSEANNKKKYQFDLPHLLVVQLDCKINTLRFEKFKPKNIHGNLVLTPNRLIVKNAEIEIANGKFKFETSINRQKDSTFEADINLKADKIKMDSLLYVFDNFGQKFIKHSNLQGVVSADIQTTFNFNKNLEIDQRKLLFQTSISIKNGHLIEFEPLKNLSKFVNEKYLNDIKFSELKNTFQIADRTIFIPEMTIKSNINTINMMGWHTFDNEFEYRLKIPLRNYKKSSNIEQENAVEGNATNGFYLYVIMKGNPNDFKIYYDKAAVKQKIKERWLEERKEFTDIFRKDYQKRLQEKQKVQELNSESYLDL